MGKYSIHPRKCECSAGMVIFNLIAFFVAAFVFLMGLLTIIKAIANK